MKIRVMACETLVSEIRTRLESSDGKTIQDVAGLVGLDVEYIGDMKYMVREK